MKLFRKRRVIIGLFLLGFIISCWFFRERAHLVWQYYRFVSDPVVREVLDTEPPIEHWDLSGNGREISIGFAKFNYPFLELDNVSLHYSKVIFTNPFSKIMFGPPCHYSYDLYKKMTIKEASEKYSFTNFVWIWENTVFSQSRSKGEWETEEIWQEIESNRILLAYWKKYTDEPYEWHKQTLSITPKSLLTILFMDLCQLKLYYDMLKSKHYMMKHSKGIIFFETSNLINGILEIVDFNSVPRIVVAAWDAKRMIKQIIVVDCKGGTLQLNKTKQLVSSFQYEIDEVSGDEDEFLESKILKLEKYPFFTIDNDTFIAFIEIGCNSATIERAIPYVENIDMMDFAEMTSLHVAVLKNRVDVLNLIIGHGADVNVGVGKLGTPLHFAVLADNIDLVKVLLEGGADINVITRKNETPLSLAVMKDNRAIVKFLLDNGASVDIKDQYGFTPYAATSPAMQDYIRLHPSCRMRNFEEIEFTVTKSDAKYSVEEYLFDKKGSRFTDCKGTIKINRQEGYYAFIYPFDCPMVFERDEIFEGAGYFSDDDGFWVKVSGVTGELEFFEIDYDGEID